MIVVIDLDKGEEFIGFTKTFSITSLGRQKRRLKIVFNPSVRQKYYLLDTLDMPFFDNA